jgi:hypothetical protein
MSVPTTSSRGSRIAVMTTLALLLAVGLPAASSSAAGSSGAGGAPATKTLYHGGAWGSMMKQDQALKSGRSAPVTLSCITVPGKTFRNEVGAVHAPQGAFHTGAVVDTAQSIASPDGQTARETSTVHGLSMLGGVVRADTMKAVSATTLKNGRYSFSTAGSQFVDLTINGQAINQSPTTQTIPLPGLGKVTLFAHAHSIRNGVAAQFVNMLVVDVLHPNDQGIPVGTRMVVAHALSRLEHTAGPLGGRAWGSSVAVGSTVESGPSFTTYLPCAGTNGHLISQSGASEGLPAPIVAGTVTNTAKGTVGRLVTSGETSSQIANIDLGDGQITADLVKADVKIERKNGQITVDTSGSHLGGLMVQGQGQNGSPDPNTVIQVPGLGKLTLYEVTRGKNFVIVRELHLQVLHDNPDIPLGTDVTLGYAKVSVH